MECKQNPNLGIIFHWGPYSVPAFDDPASAARRKTQNGSEWYLKRLTTTPEDYRPVSGWKETQSYHAEHFPELPYDEFFRRFSPTTWDPDSWMKLCVQAGASYVILTSRHHDGYCLWPTKTGPSSGVDLIQKFKDSALKHGLTFGLYYSWFDFGHSCTKEYLTSVVEPQISELLRYEPRVWWFDGHWMCRSAFAIEFIRAAVARIHRQGAVVNDRLGLAFKDANELQYADYRVYEDRAIPQTAPLVAWEHINTIGLSWGRNKRQRPSDYKSAADLLALYRRVRTLGGRLLLNLGPGEDGSLDPLETAALTAFGELLRKEEEAKKAMPQDSNPQEGKPQDATPQGASSQPQDVKPQDTKPQEMKPQETKPLDVASPESLEGSQDQQERPSELSPKKRRTDCFC